MLRERFNFFQHVFKEDLFFRCFWNPRRCNNWLHDFFLFCNVCSSTYSVSEISQILKELCVVPYFWNFSNLNDLFLLSLTFIQKIGRCVDSKKVTFILVLLLRLSINTAITLGVLKFLSNILPTNFIVNLKSLFLWESFLVCFTKPLWHVNNFPTSLFYL